MAHGKRKKGRLNSSRNFFAALCLLPWLTGVAVFTLYPIEQSFLYSFSKTKFLTGGTVELQFVGWGNYSDVLFKDTKFKLALFQYLQQIGYMVPVMVVFSLLTAIMLNTKIHFRGVFRMIYFLPVILMQGVLYDILSSLDAMSISGLSTFFVFQFITDNLPSVISSPIMYIMNHFVTIIWMSGVQILIFLTGLQRVDSRIYEAALVDGAGSWQSFWKITLPAMKPFIVVNGIYSVVSLSTSSLNPFISIIKDNMFTSGNGFGFSAAVTWMYFLLILVFVAVAAFVCNGCRIGVRKVKRRVQ